MNDTKPDLQQNQEGIAKPIFETVPVEEYNDVDTASPVSSDPAYTYEESKTKYLVIALAVIFFVVVFIFFVRFLGRFNKNNANKKITLVYWGLWEDKAVFDPLIEAYRRKNPNISINYTKMDSRDYREKLIERSKNGQGPDVFRFHNTWLPSLKEVVAPIPKSIVSNEEFEKTFYPVAQTDLKIDDFYYGLPLEIDGLILIYNDDLLKRAGFAVPPKTWEEIVHYATTISLKDQEGKIVTSGIALGTASNVEHFSDILGWMLLQNGGDIKKIDGEEGMDALQAFRKFAEPPNNLWDESLPNSISAFTQEKVAMIIAPSWEISLIKLVNPELKLKTAILPTIPGGNKVSLANYWVEGVSKLSKNQVAGWNFLKFLIEKENLTNFYKSASKTRLFGEPYSRVDLGSILLQNEYIGPVIEQAPYMKSLPLVARTYDNGMNDEIIKYIEDAINSTVNGVSYEESLATAQKGVEQVFEKYGF